MPIQPQAAEILFGRTSYIKKLIEDANLSEETVKLLQFCCWENPHFSRIVLSELLWQIAYAYCHELRHHMDLLLSMLLIEDSWQSHRIHNALKGVPEEREGLFDTIQRSKNHYQKRAYQCIKCMVTLFSNCRPAHQLLHTNGEIKRKWTLAVEWLQDELERRPYAPSAQYSYNNWSPPAQSNESTNGYFLERSNSARKTLERACELCPEEEPEVEEMSEEGESPQPEEQQPPQQKVPPTFTAYPAYAEPFTITERRRARQHMRDSSSYIIGVKEQQLSPRPSGDNSNHPQVGTSEDTEEKVIESANKHETDDVYAALASKVAERNARIKGSATDIKHNYLIETSMTPAATQDSGNEHTLSNSSSSTLVQQSSEQQQCEEIDHPPYKTADSA